MKKIGMLFAFVLVTACGGGSKDTTTTPDPAASTVPETDETTYAAGGDTGTTPGTEEPTAGTTDATAMGGGTTGGMPAAPDKNQPAPAEPAPPPAPMTATAELKSVKDDSSMGTITFTKRDDGKIVIEGTFSGLKKKGTHALYIHEKGDCSKKGANVGGHLNPTKAKHGPPSSGNRHAGDFGNVTADDTGAATFTMETDSVTMDDIGRADTIVNRSIVLHEKKDSKSGNAGKPLACGVITQAGGAAPAPTTP
jgi:Cu-Zn family superoxide dismutase